MVLNIKWQRLTVDGETCERCGLTEDEVENAVSKLEKALKPLNIDVKFKKKEISKAEFEKNPLSSNVIFINGKSLEDWLDAETGKSECCYVCEDDCRTVIVSGKEYEVVPSELIVRAGLKAASEEKSVCSCNSRDSDCENCCS